MEVIKEGTWYELESTNKTRQSIIFIHKDDKTGSIVQGTTTEEVLQMLIDRLETLNVKNKSFENDSAIRNLENALREIKKRNKNKSDRKFKYKNNQTTRDLKHDGFDIKVTKTEGTNFPSETLLFIEEKNKKNDKISEEW